MRSQFGRVMMRLNATNPVEESRMRARQKQAKDGRIEEFKDDDAVTMAIMHLLPENASDQQVKAFIIGLPEDDGAFWDNLRSSTKDSVAQMFEGLTQAAPAAMKTLSNGLAGVIRGIREPLGETLARKGIF